jgi:hypothetical protein
MRILHSFIFFNSHAWDAIFVPNRKRVNSFTFQLNSKTRAKKPGNFGRLPEQSIRTEKPVYAAFGYRRHSGG